MPTCSHALFCPSGFRHFSHQPSLGSIGAGAESIQMCVCGHRIRSSGLFVATSDLCLGCHEEALEHLSYASRSSRAWLLHERLDLDFLRRVAREK